MLLTHLQKNCQRRGQLKEVGVKQEGNKNDPVSRPAKIKTEPSESYTETEIKSDQTQNKFEVSTKKRSSKSLQCQHCPKVFARKDTFDKHVQIHYQDQLIECFSCNKQFKQEFNLKGNLLIHTAYKPFQCTHCSIEPTKQEHFKEHKWVHTGGTPYDCKNCYISFANKANFTKHAKKCKLEEKLETSFPLLLADSLSEPKSLTLDLSAEDYNSIPEEQMWGMICQYVNFGADLNLSHNYPNFYKHSQCKSEIFAKITSKKGASKSFVCHYCAKVFARKDIRDKHIRIHTGDRPFKCSACHKSFIQEAHLKEHQLLHTGEKPYQCSYCDKAFTKRSHMKDHVRAHTGEKPHKCKNCDFRSVQRSNLNKHEKICVR